MSFFENTRKPVGFSGKIMVAMMNFGHSAMAAWGLHFLQPAPDAMVLDCGCGGGANIKTLLKRCPKGKVQGIDYSAVSVEKARKVNAGAIAAGQCIVQQASVAELPFEAEQFDVVTAFETVVLLSHKKADSYIHIDVEFGEGEGKIPVDSIAKRAEAYKPKEKVTYKMIKEYIEAKYGFKVHTAYIAEVKRNLGLPMYDAPNAVEELKQPRKHPTPEKIEAIKDALRYFAVI